MLAPLPRQKNHPRPFLIGFYRHYFQDETLPLPNYDTLFTHELSQLFTHLHRRPNLLRAGKVLQVADIAPNLIRGFEATTLGNIRVAIESNPTGFREKFVDYQSELNFRRSPTVTRLSSLLSFNAFSGVMQRIADQYQKEISAGRKREIDWASYHAYKDVIKSSDPEAYRYPLVR